ncbi:MAG: ATP-binding protein [Bacteroidota bacterium]
MPGRAVILALDDLSLRGSLEKVLLDGGYRPVSAPDVRSLRAAIGKSRPAVMVIGETVEGRSGLELAQEVLERFPALPVILCPGDQSAEQARIAVAAGLSGILCPPFDENEILTTVSDAIARGRRLDKWFRRELRQETAYAPYEAILSGMQGGAILLDERENVIFINRAACSAFEVRPQDVTGRPIREAIPHPDLGALMKRTFADAIPYHEIRLDTGQVLNAQFTPIPGTGSAISMQDISGLKELERRKNDFIHTVSHDLRSPLTALLGYAELIERVGGLTEQQHDFLERMRASALHITTLVNDLLDLGRLEAGLDARNEAVDLGTMLGHSLDSLEGQAHAKSMEVHCAIEPDLPPVRANPIRIRQLLDNLVGNAIKYTPEKGSVRLSAAASEKQVIIEVTDTGPGIPLEEQTQIFEKFYRGNNVPETIEGTGLGLAIVKSIVEGYNGRIWVESAPGRGSSFFVVLPADEQSM